MLDNAQKPVKFIEQLHLTTKMPINLIEKILRGTYVSFKYKYVYFPVSKSANTSIKHMLHELENLPSIDPMCDSFGVNDRRNVVHKRHMVSIPSLLEISQQQFDEIINDSSWLKFSVGRNPLERVVAYYFNKIATWNYYDVCMNILQQNDLPIEEGIFINFEYYLNFVIANKLWETDKHFLFNESATLKIKNVELFNIKNMNDFIELFSNHVKKSIEIKRYNENVIKYPVSFGSQFSTFESVYSNDIFYDENFELDYETPNYKTFLPIIVENNIMIHKFRERLVGLTNAVKENY